MSARGLLAKPTTRQVMVYICVFLYQGYDILFYREAHCTPWDLTFSPRSLREQAKSSKR